MTMSAEPVVPVGVPVGRKQSNLERIEARLARIEDMLSRMDAVANQVPGLFAMASDIADEWATRDGRVDARLREVVQVLERLTRPDVLRALQSLLAQLEAAPGLFAMIGDMVDDFARGAQAEGVDLHEATSNLLESVRALVKLLGQPETRDVIEHGVLSPGAIRSMNMAAHALAEAGQHRGERVGLWSAVSKTRDPDVQRALAFMFHAAKTLGQAMDNDDAEGSAPARLKAPNGS